MQDETSQIIELAKKDLLKNGNYNLDELMDKVGLSAKKKEKSRYYYEQFTQELKELYKRKENLKKESINNTEEYLHVLLSLSDVINGTRKQFEEKFNIQPLKEFGTNYAEFYHDGTNAISKLLRESRVFKGEGEFNAQVAGAFYKEGLGDIDLVWGNEKMGLRHILEKHSKEFKDIASEINEIMEKGIIDTHIENNKIAIKTNRHTLILGNKKDNKFIITAYRDSRNKKLDNQQTGVGANLTNEPLDSNPLSLNQHFNSTTNKTHMQRI